MLNCALNSLNVQLERGLCFVDTLIVIDSMAAPCYGRWRNMYGPESACSYPSNGAIQGICLKTGCLLETRISPWLFRKEGPCKLAPGML